MRRYRGLQIAEFCTQVLVLLSKLADISFLCAKFILPDLRGHIKRRSTHFDLSALQP